MNVTSKITEPVFHLKSAILLRESLQKTNHTGHFKPGTIASIHDIVYDADGNAQVGAGQLLKAHVLAAMVEAITPAQGIQFLPESVLAHGVQGLLWWKKPTTEMVWFNTDDEKDGIGARCGPVPLPGLVFFTNRNNWYVFAVKGNTRPTLETPLFMAPFFNLSEVGLICTGNAELPKTFEVKDIGAYEKTFFTSRFTHPGAKDAELTVYRGGVAALWRRLLSGKAKTFPESSLLPLDMTVGEWFTRQLGRK